MTKEFLKTSFLVSYLLILLNGCNEQRKGNLFIDAALGRNLMLANQYISQNTTTQIQTFRNYSNNPAVSTKTNPVLENMGLVRKISTGTLEYFDELKRNLKIEAGLKLIDSKETFNEDDFKAVTTIFKEKKKGLELYEHLIKYQSSIQQINPDLSTFLKSPYYFFDSFSTPKDKLEAEFTNIYFDNTNAISALAVIIKFENDVRVYENKAVSFFFSKVAIDLPVMSK